VVVKGWGAVRSSSVAWVRPLVTAFLFAACVLCAHGQDVRPTEAQVKAAYLYKFGKFVRWPAERAVVSSFEICILGKDPFGQVLDSTVAGESMDGKKIAVRRLTQMQDAPSCKVLYISASEASRLDVILPVARHLALLTVSDMQGFAEQGGVIGLVTQDEKVRFELNRGAAEQSDLVLSSELMKIASKVIDKKSSP